MGKLNVKSGVATFSNINDGSALEIDARGGGERGLGWKKEVATSFLSLSHSLSFRASLPRPNRSRK